MIFGWFILSVIVGVIGFLLLLEPDFGAAVVIVLTGLGMMFLSGVFFENDVLPYWIKIIGQNLPLSPLVTAMRESSLYGANTLDLLPEVGLIIIWIIVCFIIGIKTFKWE